MWPEAAMDSSRNVHSTKNTKLFMAVMITCSCGLSNYEQTDLQPNSWHLNGLREGNARGSFRDTTHEGPGFPSS